MYGSCSRISTIKKLLAVLRPFQLLLNLNVTMTIFFPRNVPRYVLTDALCRCYLVIITALRLVGK